MYFVDSDTGKYEKCITQESVMVFGMTIIFLNLQHDVSGPECKSLREQGARKKRVRCPFVCLRLRLWRCSASGSHELFVRGNCMPNCMCLRARVCLRM